ncbi:magnesium transporter [Pseudorhodobacter antarcticus]|uniref:Magnesium transporter MgtE n=1 Tax=Pseudorhodobacter antarcticus TaxID=1077947 RepID=A0A1H8L368_9RHOB|nr:magnesium transporter [Pseudorhodobacter antarcticus]SEN99640.1 magnesium transporter [Pseudorhodobacter antarcticus]
MTEHIFKNTAQPSKDASNEIIALFIAASHPVDLADWLGQLLRSEASNHFATLSLRRRAEVFGHLSLGIQADLARAMPPDAFAQILIEMDADDRTDLLKHLTQEERQQALKSLPQKARDDTNRLSAHREGTAGAIMTSDFAVLSPTMKTMDAIVALRCAAPDAETIYRSYVLDADGRLIGSVRLHQLILAADDAVIGGIMQPISVMVMPETGQEDVAKAIARYDLLALPVVDAAGRLVGIVTHDDAADALKAETTEDFQKISTVLPFTQSMRDASFRMLYSKRIFWLSLLVFGNLFSGAGIAYYEETILTYVSLVFFLPLLIDSSGNAGAQSATLMVRALATGDVVLQDWRDLIVRELAVAAALGGTMALVVLPLGALRGGTEIALVVGLTMFVVVIVGSLVGMSLPFLLSRLRLDPATASGPLVTTISDGVGVMVYFAIATAVLTL